MLLLMVVLSGGSNSDGNSPQKISQQFYEDASEIIGIYDEVISNTDIYLEEEREKITKFDDTQYNEVETKIKKQLIQLSVRYFLNYDSINDSSNNSHLIKEYLDNLSEIKMELESLYKQ
jgi:hypothetical protein